MFGMLCVGGDRGWGKVGWTWLRYGYAGAGGWDEQVVESGGDRASGIEIVAASAISPYRHNPEHIL